ncbi:MAG: hypothetical protein OQJ98_02665 [Candidatus Pacebacteria bacterium]|nr:hypothetical protein [Candidatus Paceibacterota bacterium]
MLYSTRKQASLDVLYLTNRRRKEQLMTRETVQHPSQGQLLDIIATLTGAIPDLTREGAQRIIENKKMITPRIRDILSEVGQLSWRSLVIEIGGMPKKEMLHKLKKARTKAWARDMFEGCPEIGSLSESVPVRLVGHTIAELGFKEKPTYPEVCQRGIERGCRLCHPEVGPRLWIQGGLEDGGYHIAMDPLPDKNGTKEPFFLAFANGADEKNREMYHWLHAGPGLKANLELDSRFIFAVE